MPLLTPSARIVINGSLGQGEVFSTGFWVACVLPTSQANADALAQTFATALRAQMLPLAAFLGTDGQYNQVKVYWYGSPTPAPVTYLSLPTITPVVGTGALVAPLQTAVVASLRSTINTRSGRGRMYLPASGAGLSSHQLTSAQCTTIANAVKGMLAASSNLSSNPVTPIIQSTRIASTILVNNIIVDSRTDVQRRRATKETVLFSSSAAYP